MIFTSRPAWIATPELTFWACDGVDLLEGIRKEPIKASVAAPALVIESYPGCEYTQPMHMQVVRKDVISAKVFNGYTLVDPCGKVCKLSSLLSHVGMTDGNAHAS